MLDSDLVFRVYYLASRAKEVFPISSECSDNPLLSTYSFAMTGEFLSQLYLLLSHHFDDLGE